MDILKLINELESLIENQTVVVGLTWGFHPDEYLDMTNKIRASLPEELKRATKVAADSEKIVDGARLTAEQTLEDAGEEAEQITRDARATAERHLREAETQSTRIVSNAEQNARLTLADAKKTAEQMLRDAQQKAEKLVHDATQLSERLVDESEVVRVATARAVEIDNLTEQEALLRISNADIAAESFAAGADDYARITMLDLERDISELLATIQKGKTALDQRIASKQSRARAEGAVGRGESNRNHR